MQLVQLQPRTTAIVAEEPVVKRFHIWTIGCQMNEAESAKAAALLRQAGYLPAAREWDADVVIVNTCVVRQQAEDKALGYIGALARLKRRKPHVRIAVTGCLVTGQERRLAERFPWVDLWYGPSEFERLVQLVPELAEVDVDLVELPHYYDEGQADPEVTAFVPVIYGCNFVCSYCIVPYRRGRERSRPIEQVVAEVEKLAARNVREVTLLGQTVNAYGHDLPGQPDLADLLARVHEVPGIERIRFLTSHPKYFSDKLVRAIAELPKVCEHVNLPVQAGDNEVLRRMRRNYTVEEYRERIARIREWIPEVTLSTDIIVGFPGETEDQFLNTYRLVEEIQFDKVHVAMYSPRPGTLSARWPDDVPREEKRRRHRAIEELQERIARERNQRYLGRTVEILVDGVARGRWRGRTRGNTLVFFEAPGEWRGRLVQVRITHVSPWYLLGEPVAVESPRAVGVAS
ncbi:tRNA (N6-isopentenyl adenosine(37)-C2)-methylthiotransferase MiaB [Thermomicrobium sp. CFH 73360]|uniref:tRNA (N6-isopentenyl adenosine(37)-C2)-methylthiotransferase MiaB n=1 Tax=Thermomicrobium sp. CFH 73360 TaxID=2951987 RepID=UPI002076A3EE|nr:tRNA (N6-isopentenyl adenosine(37)-C2)-methylthiotransferase MiaB [Thermomicrobium sp. CFH 73360]MCM8745632.1 tRNA (N6-isopentenyl adenosine(37)-C2)-methylthiotransferase MiaB [Thermomicrobium sp. CFH 73360]